MFPTGELHSQHSRLALRYLLLLFEVCLQDGAFSINFALCLQKFSALLLLLGDCLLPSLDSGLFVMTRKKKEGESEDIEKIYET